MQTIEERRAGVAAAHAMSFPAFFLPRTVRIELMREQRREGDADGE